MPGFGRFFLYLFARFRVCFLICLAAHLLVRSFSRSLVCLFVYLFVRVCLFYNQQYLSISHFSFPEASSLELEAVNYQPFHFVPHIGIGKHLMDNSLSA